MDVVFADDQRRVHTRQAAHNKEGSPLLTAMTIATIPDDERRFFKMERGRKARVRMFFQANIGSRLSVVRGYSG
jgi:hypothetical protein